LQNPITRRKSIPQKLMFGPPPFAAIQKKPAMPSSTDQELLLAWAGQADEAAFRALSTRYAGFVYGAALRRVGESGLAQEITQDVFIVLARQARKLSSHVTLAGWLHRTAMLIALDRLRRKSRRERKLDHFQAMHADSPSHDPWPAAGPHLDEALDGLRAGDRHLLLLHFAERCTFPEMAARLGSTTDAVRMRTTRALQALSKILRGKGAALSLAALSAGLGGALAQAAPASLLISAVALPGAAKVSLSTILVHAFHTMKSLQYAAVLCALASATTAILQRTQIAQADDRIAALRVAVGDQQDIRNHAASLIQVATAQSSVVGLNLRQLSRDALDESLAGARSLQRIFARLDANNLAGLMETVMGTALLPQGREKLISAILEEMARRSPALHLQGCLKVLRATNHVEFFRDVAERMAASASAFALAQPELQWTLSHQEEWDQALARYLTWEDNSLLARMASGLLTSNPQKALALLERMSTYSANSAVEKAAKNLTAPQLQVIAQWAAHRPDPSARRDILRTLGTATRFFVAADKAWLEPVGDLLRSVPISDEDRAWLAARISVERGLAADLEKSPIPERAAWLERLLPPADASRAIGSIAQMLEPATALRFLQERLAANFDENLIAGYLEGMDLRGSVRNFRGSVPGGGLQGKTAFELALRVPDPLRRRPWLEAAWSDLFGNAPEEARALLALPELDPADSAALQEKFATQLQAKK
jgi:RNA polymerase sigma-70 factor (ECF subfamily)